jgi:Ca-activated chloride channel family protein
MTRLTAAVTAALLSGASLLAQSPSQGGERAVLRIVEPTPATLMAGDVRFKATVAPEDPRVTSVEFFVDGGATAACRAENVPFECVYYAGERIAARTVRAVAHLADGDRLTAAVTTARGVGEVVEVNAILVSAVVTDGRGRFVQNLTKDSFRVFERGQASEKDQEQTLTFAAAENVPIEIVFAVDLSGSMVESLPTLKAAIASFLASAERTKARGADTHVTVLGFNDRTYVVARRDTPVSEQVEAVKRLNASGGSRVYDAILNAVNRLGRDISRKAVIVFTDGDDRSSLASIDAIRSRLRQSDGTMYVIPHGKASKSDAGRRGITALAGISGGRPFPIQNVSQLEKTLAEIMEDLTHQYLMGYTPKDIPRPGEYRALRVETMDKSLRVRAREGYRMPDGTQ